jgi:hypothetical protein
VQPTYWSILGYGASDGRLVGPKEVGQCRVPKGYAHIRTLNLFFEAAKALSTTTLRLESHKLNNKFALCGSLLALNLLYLVFLKGGRIPTQHAYPTSPM